MKKQMIRYRKEKDIGEILWRIVKKKDSMQGQT